MTPATTSDLVNALRARDRAAINASAASLLQQGTALGGQWFSVAQVLVRNGEISLALEAANRGVAESGGAGKARLELAHVLSSVGRQEEALKILEEIHGSDADPVDRGHLLGTCAMELGDFDRAREAFDEVLARWPGLGPSWLSLSALPNSADANLLERLEAAAPAVAATPPDYRAPWHYAKGAVLDRLGGTDDAFGEFSAGARLIRPTRPYDSVSDTEEADRIASEFTRQAIDSVAAQVTTDSASPIIVTGLPRSGTTLVEQILSAHSQVVGGGEMPFGSILLREIGGSSLSNLHAYAAAHGADALTRLYLHLGEERFGSGGFVDKGLGNSRALGVLASVLPQAKIIWLRRDPLDCAWSCFRTYFSQGIEWSWSLTDIAAHFAAEDRLYAHWRDVLGDRILTLSYEELTADPGGQTRRILAHVGLEPEAGTEAAHQARRPVSTASVAQVRQPVYRSSIGAAERYRTHLQPFVEGYAASASAG